MKIPNSILFFILLILFSSTIIASETIKVTGHPDYPPVIWLSKKENTLKGISIEIIQEIFKELNIQIDLVPVNTWGRALEEVIQGRVDILLPPYKTDERLITYNFSQKPFMFDRTVLFVKKGSKIKFEKIEDLKGLKGVAIINDSFGNEFDKAAKDYLKIQRLSKTSQSLKFLLRGRADYLVAGYNAGISVASEEGILNEIEVLEKDVISTGMYIAISKNSKFTDKKIMDTINKYLNEKLTKAKLNKLEEKYLKVFANEK